MPPFDYWTFYDLPTPAQARAARAVVGIGIREIATEADTTTRTVTRYLTHEKEVTAAIVRAVQHVFEDHGIEFYRTDDGHPGIRLPKQTSWHRPASRSYRLSNRQSAW